MSHLRLGVLVSGRGSNLQSILDAQKDGRIDASVVVVLSNKKDAYALERAKAHDVPVFGFDPQEFDSKEQYEGKLLEIIHEYQVDVILLAGYMRVLSPYFIREARLPIINIHPSLLPAFPGLHAQQQALDYGVRYSGCTIHFVDEGVDSGPVIAQAVVPVYADDTKKSLSERILQEEHRLYPEVIRLLCANRIYCQGRKVIILGEGEKLDKASLNQCL